MKKHVIVLVLWHTGHRAGALRGLDVWNLDSDGEYPNADRPAIHFVHWPPETPMKNGGGGERLNTISGHVTEVLAV